MAVYNPIVTFPTSGDAIDSTEINRLEWNYIKDDDDTTVQFSYEVEILDSDNNVIHNSGIINSSNEYYDLPATTLTNGNLYKWRPKVNSNKTPTRASVFYAHDKPVATVDTLPSPFLFQFYNFTGTVTQAQSILVNTFQWNLYDASDVLLFQSPIIKGQIIEYEFTELENGTTYKVDYTVTMQDGLVSTSNRLTFTPSYSAPVSPDLIQVSARNDLIMNKMNWSGVVTQTGQVFNSSGVEITPTYTTGVWGFGLSLSDGDYLFYDLISPIPFNFSSDYWISLPSGFNGNFFELYNNTTNELEYQIGYSQENGAFYYQRGYRRTTSQQVSIPVGFFKIIVTPRYFGFEISGTQYEVR